MTAITKRQYYISNQKVGVDGLCEHTLGDGVYLYADKELNLNNYYDKYGRMYFLLGYAFCTDSSPKSVESDFAVWDKDDLSDLSYSWTGRYLLISQSEIITDACGLMGAFYYEKDGVWAISSSLALIMQVQKVKSLGKVVPKGLSWQMLPLTVADGVRKLTATQKIMYSAEKIRVEKRMWIRDYTQTSSADKSAMLADMLTNAVVNMNEYSGRNMLLALTAGKDSRLVMAALCKSKVPFSAYTAQHGSMSAGDKKLPKVMAEKLGIPYFFIPLSDFSQERERDYLNFTAQNTTGADMSFFAHGQLQRLPSDALVIRSGFFEAGQLYARTIAPADFDGFAKAMRAYYHDLNSIERQGNAFDEWLEFVRENPCDFIDLRDRFYLEQRVGGWGAAIEQSLDICDFVSLQIADSASILSLLLCCNEVERNNLSMSLDTIKLLYPTLLDFPVNPQSMKDKFKKLGSKVKRKILAIKR